MNPKVDFFFKKAKKWREERELLRTICNETGLAEELKWGCPCYTEHQHNIVLIHAFNNYCALLFFKGALMSDPHGVLIQQTKNSQVTRQIRFENVKDIKSMTSIIKSYISEASDIEKAGLKVILKKTSVQLNNQRHANRVSKNTLRTFSMARGSMIEPLNYLSV